MTCTRCGSQAINPQSHGRKPGVDLDLCDVCYWRKRAEVVPELIEALQEIAEALERHYMFMGYDVSSEEIEEEGGDAAYITWNAQVARAAISKATAIEKE